jgi:two-component system, OmpR family, response regulator
MKVLIVEDDARLSRLMATVLAEEYMAVEQAYDGDNGLEMALRGMYDVAVVDWMLPGRDGPSICRAIRAARLPTALLLLTARSQLEDRVTGLDSGADDYLTKPFAFEELLARIRALGRRFTVINGGDLYELHYADLVMDIRTHTVRRADIPVDLTLTEWNLLECFVRNSGRVLTRQQIVDYVWSYERNVQESLVDVYVAYLRKKINANGGCELIQTVRGVGYSLKECHA